MHTQIKNIYIYNIDIHVYTLRKYMNAYIDYLNIYIYVQCSDIYTKYTHIYTKYTHAYVFNIHTSTLYNLLDSLQTSPVNLITICRHITVTNLLQLVFIVYL